MINQNNQPTFIKIPRLTAPKVSRSGRDQTGQISVRHRGGGVKRHLRIITTLDKIADHQVKIIGFQHDPNRTADLIVVENSALTRYYILAPDQVKIGDQIQFNPETVPISPGNRTQLKNIPPGTSIYEIETRPGSNNYFIRSAGTSGQLLAIEGNDITIKLPSGTVYRFNPKCLASIGKVGSIKPRSRIIGRAGINRRLGIRPTVRGKAMHPKAHPHGGGEGVNPIGLKHPKTPTGRPALGAKTRSSKRTDRYIVTNHRRK